MCPGAPKKRASLPRFRASLQHLRNVNLDASTDVSFLKNSLYQFNDIILQTVVIDDDENADGFLNDVSYWINSKNQFNDFFVSDGTFSIW